MAPSPLGCSFAPNLEAKESSHLSNHKLDHKKDVKCLEVSLIRSKVHKVQSSIRLDHDKF